MASERGHKRNWRLWKFFGIPIVGGEVFFDDCYNTNPLVNAFSAGIMKTGDMISATSTGVGNPVFIVGSRTGKDGIHGLLLLQKILLKSQQKICRQYK